MAARRNWEVLGFLALWLLSGYIVACAVVVTWALLS